MNSIRVTLGLAFAVLLLPEPPCLSASPEFASAFEKALNEIAHDFPSKRGGERDHFAAETSILFNVGNRDEIGDAVAATLGNPQKRSLWLAAASIADTLGPQYDRTKIVSAVRNNLAHYFMLDDAKNLGGYGQLVIHLAADALCYYGTDADVERVKAFADEIAKLNPSLAESIGFTIYNRAKVLELRAKVLSDIQSGKPNVLSKDIRLSFPKADLPNPDKTPEAKVAKSSDEQPASTPWFVWAVVVFAAIGLLWLFLKKQ